jgi:hypothetical protein
VRVSLDDWDRRDPALDRWARPRDFALDRRLGELGYRPQSGFHHEACTVGLWKDAPCSCRQAVARESRRRRTRRSGELFTR